MRIIFCTLLAVVLCSSVALAQSQPEGDSIEYVWSEISRTVADGDYDSYEAVFHPDAIGFGGPNGEDLDTRLISNTLKRNKVGMADVRNGLKTPGIEFRITSETRGEQSAKVKGMLHHWVSRTGSDRVDSYGIFEAYLVKKDRWLILVNINIPSTQEEWDKLN